MSDDADARARLERIVMHEFSEGVCGDGAAILMDGIPLCISDILERLRALERMHTAMPSDEWHEDLGPVLWWFFPIQEEPYCGTPNDDDWPGDYLTHWSPIPIPVAA